jgi:uncharacterized BrkB/YihY/UPF0761 family membrane protein
VAEHIKKQLLLLLVVVVVVVVVVVIVVVVVVVIIIILLLHKLPAYMFKESIQFRICSSYFVKPLVQNRKQII